MSNLPVASSFEPFIVRIDAVATLNRPRDRSSIRSWWRGLSVRRKGWRDAAERLVARLERVTWPGQLVHDERLRWKRL